MTNGSVFESAFFYKINDTHITKLKIDFETLSR